MYIFVIVIMYVVFWTIVANTKKLYNIYTMLVQRRRHWADEVRVHGEGFIDLREVNTRFICIVLFVC